MPDRLLSDSPYAAVDLDMDDDWKMVFQQSAAQSESSGITALQNRSFDNDGLIYHQEILKLTSFVANIPFEDEKEVQVVKKLLLGPPTIEAARRCKYLHSYMIRSKNVLFNVMQFKHTYRLIRSHNSLLATFALNHD